MERKRDTAAFCRGYLRTMDPERAAESGCRDGFALLELAADDTVLPVLGTLTVTEMEA